MGAVRRSSAGFGWGSGSWRGAGAEGRCRAGRVLPGPCGGAAPAPRPAGPSVRSYRAGCGGAASSDGSGASVKELFPARAVVLHIGEGRPHGSTSSFPRGSGVFSRMPVFSGSAPMCRAGPSAHGRISTALNAGAFPHDSTDPPPTGPGRMCSTVPALPMPRTRARPPRPDTTEPHLPRTRPPAPSHRSRPSWSLRTPWSARCFSDRGFWWSQAACFWLLSSCSTSLGVR